MSVAPQPEAPPLRPTIVVLSAIAVPVVCVSADLVARASIFPRDGLVTYAAGALLSLLVWGLCMEAARHPRRAVRAVAIAFLGLVAALGIGLQLIVRTFTHAYLGRRAL